MSIAIVKEQEITSTYGFLSFIFCSFSWVFMAHHHHQPIQGNFLIYFTYSFMISIPIPPQATSVIYLIYSLQCVFNVLKYQHCCVYIFNMINCNVLQGSFSFYLFLKFFLEIQLIYNAVLVSGVQQNDSDIYIYILFFFLQDIEYSPCAMQRVPVGYLFYIQQYVYFNPKLLIYPSLPLPFGNHKFAFYVCESVSVL